MKKDIRPSLLLLYPLSYFHLGCISFFPRLFGARTPHAHACHISQCIHIPAATSTGFNFFSPSVSYSISRNVSGFVFSFPFLMFPVHCSEQYCPWLCKQCNAFCLLFLLLIPRSSFVFFLPLVQHSILFLIPFLAYVIALLQFFFTIRVLCLGLLFYSQFEYGLCI